MDLKYRTMLQNVPVRHLINKMKMTETEAKAQMQRFQQVDLNNIFLLMTKPNAEKYLAWSDDIGMTGIKFAWFVLSMVSWNIEYWYKV